MWEITTGKTRPDSGEVFFDGGLDLTKLDEAAHVGGVLSVVRKVNKSLSYVTTGQDVPGEEPAASDDQNPTAVGFPTAHVGLTPARRGCA